MKIFKMNYITTNHQGGLCNVLFKLSAAISLSVDNEIDYIFSNEFIRYGYDPDYNRYKDNVLRNIDFVDVLPDTYDVYHEPSFSYNEINYENGKNLLLSGYYQSEMYFKKNKRKIIDLFKPTEKIKFLLCDKILDLQKSSSIHVRRGDYLNLPDFHPQQPIEYYKKAVNILGHDKNYLIFSDDINGIKEMFDFIPNKTFVSLGEDFLDLYAMSLCEHNIICNSTFGWWGAYLNENENKKVIAPKFWFGPNLSNNNTKDLIPEEWIVI